MAEAAHKPDKDYTKEVDQQIPQAELLAKVGTHCEVHDIPIATDSAVRHRPTCKVPSSSCRSSKSKPVK